MEPRINMQIYFSYTAAARKRLIKLYKIFNFNTIFCLKVSFLTHYLNVWGTLPFNIPNKRCNTLMQSNFGLILICSTDDLEWSSSHIIISLFTLRAVTVIQSYGRAYHWVWKINSSSCKDWNFVFAPRDRFVFKRLTRYAWIKKS